MLAALVMSRTFLTIAYHTIFFSIPLLYVLISETACGFKHYQSEVKEALHALFCCSSAPFGCFSDLHCTFWSLVYSIVTLNVDKKLAYKKLHFKTCAQCYKNRACVITRITRAVDFMCVKSATLLTHILTHVRVYNIDHWITVSTSLVLDPGCPSPYF